MEVILLDRIGDLVKVKPGFARNYLIPQKKAVLATADAKQQVEERRKELAQMAAERFASSKARAELAPRAVTLSRKVASEEGHLFGSVSPHEVRFEVTVEVVAEE